MKSLKKLLSSSAVRYREYCIKAAVRAEQHAPLAICLALAGAFVLISADSAFAQGQNHPRYIEACNRLLGLMEGPFGALVTVGAGVGAIIASAVGGFKMAWTLVVVAVGAFILRAYVTLFFAGC